MQPPLVEVVEDEEKQNPVGLGYLSHTFHCFKLYKSVLSVIEFLHKKGKKKPERDRQPGQVLGEEVLQIGDVVLYELS